MREAGSGVGDDDVWEVPLFPSFGGDSPSKAAVTREWGELIPREAARSTGHSSRRAGAKHYARRGWSVPTIQHLGQWAGTTVLMDIVDALAELPGCRRPSEDLPPTLERLEQAETQIAKLVSELDRKTAI